jgi:hypothetical protein
MAPFLAKLPSLRSDRKAAAVNLGIFPAAGQPAYAYAAPPSAAPPPVRAEPRPRPLTQAPRPLAPSPRPLAPSPGPQSGSAVAGAVPMSGDRLASIESLLKSPPVAASVIAPPAPPPGEPARVAGISPDIRARLTPSGALSEVRPRLWVQLASGPNAAALPDQFRRIKSRHKAVFEGISGYVVEEPDRARLLIGPFRNRSEASIFIQDLESLDVSAFSWTSRPGDAIRKLPF